MPELGANAVLALSVAAMVAGLFLLIKGGDWTIESAAFVAERTGLSPLFIGATIISFGTSVPELFASVNANLSGYPGIALGNVLGSNVANILLVLGATAFIFRITAKRDQIAKDMGMMLLATGILAVGMLTDGFTRLFGLGMFVILVGFVAYQYRTDSLVVEDQDDDDAEEGKISSIRTALLFLLAGLVFLAAGAELLVEGAVRTGSAIGVPEAVIGITVVAFGTSLPELSTCIAAARNQSVGLILGNIIGSNTFNILSIIGVTAMIKPLAVDPVLLGGMDLWAMIAVTLAFAVWMMTIGRLTRATGVIMMIAYVGFVWAQFTFI
ncbi:calcium/sodium antiporter [Yoonia sp.]|uniref:calcium/sodium antiporter n=1 Tax=Yoonia sp. TaxID=2212373 RepID=UPI002FDADB8C